VSEALRLGAISFDAVKMLLLARLENRPARLDLTFYPYLPATTVGTTDPRARLWDAGEFWSCGLGVLIHEVLFLGRLLLRIS
jgi:hypothetical protein